MPLDKTSVSNVRFTVSDLFKTAVYNTEELMVIDCCSDFHRIEKGFRPNRHDESCIQT